MCSMALAQSSDSQLRYFIWMVQSHQANTTLFPNFTNRSLHYIRLPQLHPVNWLGIPSPYDTNSNKHGTPMRGSESKQSPWWPWSWCSSFYALIWTGILVTSEGKTQCIGSGHGFADYERQDIFIASQLCKTWDHMHAALKSHANLILAMGLITSSRTKWWEGWNSLSKVKTSCVDSHPGLGFADGGGQASTVWCLSKSMDTLTHICPPFPTHSLGNENTPWTRMATSSSSAAPHC